jgi:hypothetical protein
MHAGVRLCWISWARFPAHARTLLAHPTLHDAFLSYNQAADGPLAAALEAGLERLAKPLFKLRAIDVFRDKTGLAASPGLRTSLEAHLSQSRWLVVLASPASAASPWCTYELDWWLQRHGMERLLIVLTDGDLVWQRGGAGLDGARTTALPVALHARFGQEPLWVDLRGTRGVESLNHRDARLRAGLLDLSAAIRNLPKDQLDGDDVRQQRRTRRLAAAAVATIAVAAALATWQAVEATQQRNRAQTLGQQTLSRQIAAQSTALLVSNPRLALQLAAESRGIADTSESRSALLAAMSALPVSRWQQHESAWRAVATHAPSGQWLMSDMRGGIYRSADGRAELQSVLPPKQGLNLFAGVQALAFAPDGKAWTYGGSGHVLAVRADGKNYALETGDKVGEMNAGLMILDLAFSPDGSLLATASSSGLVVLHDWRTGRRRVLGNLPRDAGSLAFGPDGRWVVAGGDGAIAAFPVVPGASVPRFAASPNGSVQALQFDARGQWLFAGSYGGRIEVFDVASGRRVQSVDAPQFGALEQMAVSGDGAFVATGHAGGAVVLWQRMADGSNWPQRVLLRHAAAVRGLAFMADGRRLLSLGADGRLMLTLPVHAGRWTRREGPGPAFTDPQRQQETTSPDGRWIARAEGPRDGLDIQIDMGGVSLTAAPRLSLLQASDRRSVVDSGWLPTEPGEKSKGLPVFTADTALAALQVGDRAILWDMGEMRAWDAAAPLPPGTSLASSPPVGADRLPRLAARLGTGGPLDEFGRPPPAWHFELAIDPAGWAAQACALAGEPLSEADWLRYFGSERPYAPVCR